jgi:hypothetical protein
MEFEQKKGTKVPSLKLYRASGVYLMNKKVVGRSCLG